MKKEKMLYFMTTLLLNKLVKITCYEQLNIGRASK